MNQDHAASSEPTQSKAGPRLWRWTVTLVALVVLVGGAYRAYLWLVDDVAHRRAVAEHAAPPPESAAPDSSASAAQATPSALAVTGDPPAPAVTGGSVNQCVTGDGQVIYTNATCPQGSTPFTPGAIVPVAAVTVPPPAVSGDSADASQQQADCNFLAAEIARLDYEFRQPLPPAVLDHISTLLAGLRTQAGAARCEPPKAAASPASAPAKPAGKKKTGT